MGQTLNQEIVEKIVFDYTKAVYDKYMDGQVNFESWSELEKTVMLVYWLEMEVSNGGFHQFLVNSSGNYWAETLQALKTIEAEKIISIFKRALTVFPDSKPAFDQMSRQKQLAQTGHEAVRVLSELDDEYYALYSNCPSQDSYARMAAYIVKHQV
jgi:hypothetical protein